MLASSPLVALLEDFQYNEEETNRKLLFVSTRRVRPFQQGSEEEHGTELVLMQKCLLIPYFYLLNRLTCGLFTSVGFLYSYCWLFGGLWG